MLRDSCVHTLAYFKHLEPGKQQLLQRQGKQTAQHLLLAGCRCDLKADSVCPFFICVGSPDRAGEGGFASSLLCRASKEDLGTRCLTSYLL